MEYNYDNIGQWVADLAEKPKMTQYHTYARVIRDKERQDAERAILDKFDNSLMHGAKDVTIINDDIAIVTFTSTKNETYYVPVVKGKPTHQWFTTFESALLGALSFLKTGSMDAAKYAAKVLDVEI